MVDLTQPDLRSPTFMVATPLLLVSFLFCLLSFIVFQKKKNKNNYGGAWVDVFDNPVEATGVSTNERLKKTRNDKNDNECYVEDRESNCRDGAASDSDTASDVAAGAVRIINPFKEELREQRHIELPSSAQADLGLQHFFEKRKAIQSQKDDSGDDDNNDNGDGDGDNNNGGGGQNSKKGNGNDGDSNGSGSDKNGEGGGGGWSEMDLMGKPGFDYKYTYHAAYEFDYPVEESQDLRDQKTHSEIVMSEGLRDVSVDNFRKERFQRKRNAYNQHDKESNYNNGSGGNMTPRFFHTGLHGAHLEHCKKFYEPKCLSCISSN